MLKYVCLWKLKDDAGDEGNRLVRQYLDELPRRVGWVRSWTWGEALGARGEGFTHGFTAEFDHVEGLQGYFAHPDRLAIERRVAPYLGESLDAHYELPEDRSRPSLARRARRFRQISMFKIKTDAPPGKIDEIVEELRNLGTIVPEVRRPHLARVTDSPAGAWDLLFIWEFENREAHQRYIRHPFHGPMDERIRPFFEKATYARYDFDPKEIGPVARAEGSPSAIRHVALMQLDDATPPDKLKQIQGQLRVLGRTMAEVAGWSCGRCLGSPGSSAPGTLVLVVDFKDESAYQRFEAHPEHRAFGELLGPHLVKSAGMRYEPNCPHPGLIVFEGGVPMPVPRYRLPPMEG